MLKQTNILSLNLISELFFEESCNPSQNMSLRMIYSSYALPVSILTTNINQQGTIMSIFERYLKKNLSVGISLHTHLYFFVPIAYFTRKTAF